MICIKRFFEKKMLREIIEKYNCQYIEVDPKSEEKIVKLFQEGKTYVATTPCEFLYLGRYNHINNDVNMAMFYYKQAGKFDYIPGINLIAFLYVVHFKDYSKAIKYYKKVADLGDLSGLNHIGCVYEDYLHDYTMAEFYYKQAADVGHAPATFSLGNLYQCVYKDVVIAKDYYKKAAILGNIAAMWNLGKLCENDKDYLQAEIYYKQACEKKHKSSLLNLLSLYGNQNRHEEAFLIAYKYQNLLQPHEFTKYLSALHYPISDLNRDTIYTILETLKPSGSDISMDVFYIMQDLVARKIKILCDIAYHYKKYNK